MTPSERSQQIRDTRERIMALREVSHAETAKPPEPPKPETFSVVLTEGE